MIKQMRSENITIGRITDTEIVVTIKGNDQRLTVDEFNELRQVMDNFWGVNNLYRFTSEEIEQRKQWETQAKLEDYSGKLPITGSLRAGRF